MALNAETPTARGVIRPPTVIAALVLIAGLCGLGVGLPEMIARLDQRNAQTVRLVGEIDGERWTYRGHEGSVERIPPLPGTAAELVELSNPFRPDADATLRLTWRGQTLDFAMGPGEEPLRDGLSKWRSWFAVLLLVDGERTHDALEEKWRRVVAGEEPARLVVAARYTNEGDDPGSWGLVRRRTWPYVLAELHTGGPAEQAITVHRKDYEELDSLVLPSVYTERYRPEKMPSEEDRQSNAWMYHAMLEVTPASQYRGRNKTYEEVIRAMGWAWPAAAGGGVVALIGGIALAVTLRRGRPGA